MLRNRLHSSSTTWCTRFSNPFCATRKRIRSQAWSLRQPSAARSKCLCITRTTPFTSWWCTAGTWWVRLITVLAGQAQSKTLLSRRVLILGAEFVMLVFYICC